MRRLSISNLAWPEASVEAIAPLLKAVGMDGVELAPTAIWPEAPNVSPKEVRRYGELWGDHGLAVSGIQSLLYGHPELQLFDRRSWPSLKVHLRRMLEIANDLGAQIAVFGSPRNRLRGEMLAPAADAMCVEFFEELVPDLAAFGVVLTLEPNAPAYGADYLVRYSEVVSIADAISSPWIQPQVDTGCMTMVGEDPAAAIMTRTPGHVHISAPNLLPPPGPVEHELVVQALESTGYRSWIVLEMLRAPSNSLGAAVAAARWLTETYGEEKRDDVAS